tara:strand:+ start:66 stop:296 length:231 start_codon:yes stop_codon:yes gene_type:complete
MALDKKIASLLEKKRLILKEIEDLQNTCEHTNKIVKFVKENEDSSSFVIRQVCENCEKIIGIATQHEIFEFLNGTR